MIIIQAYKGKFEITQSQKDALLAKAKELKIGGYTHMYVDVYVPVFAFESVLEYVAIKTIDGQHVTQRAFVGKKGALSNGIGKNNKKGYAADYGNSLELVIENLDKFEHVVTI